MVSLYDRMCILSPVQQPGDNNVQNNNVIFVAGEVETVALRPPALSLACRGIHVPPYHAAAHKPICCGTTCCIISHDKAASLSMQFPATAMQLSISQGHEDAETPMLLGTSTT